MFLVDLGGNNCIVLLFENKIITKSNFMQRVNNLTLVGLQNMAKDYDYTDADKWVFPILKQKITWQGVDTNVHVARVGLNYESRGVSDVLFYVDGFGGVMKELPTNQVYKNQKRPKIKVIEKKGDLYFLFNPSVKQHEVNLVWKDDSWGYQDDNKNEFVKLAELPKGPILVDYSAAEDTEKVEGRRLIHPNIIYMESDGMESSLQLVSEDFKDHTCLHDNWGPELNVDARKLVAGIVDGAENIKEAEKNFSTWWDSPEREEAIDW